jgi:hypothetical protein
MVSSLSAHAHLSVEPRMMLSKQVEQGHLGGLFIDRISALTSR